MVDVDDVEQSSFVVDSVDDPVAPATGRSQAGKLAAQLTTEPVRLFGQQAEDEGQAGRADLFRQPQ